MLHGIFTPLVTPINPDESPDLSSLRRLVSYQLENGVSGLWALGTTSEFASFDARTRTSIAETVIDEVRGRVPIVVNVSDASTRLAIEHARRAQAEGATAIAATPPYYYPHSQDELLAHYRAIRAAVDLPLLIYNIPQTVRVRVELATAQQLAEEGTAAGIKDSQNDLEWFRQLALFVRRRSLPFSLFAGTRYLIDAAVLAGGTGAIPSLANAFPDLCVACFEAAQRGDYARAADLEDRIIALEGVARTVDGGSRNAAILGLLKVTLQDWGIIEHCALTAPLRTPTLGERGEMLTRLARLLEPASA